MKQRGSGAMSTVLEKIEAENRAGHPAMCCGQCVEENDRLRSTKAALLGALRGLVEVMTVMEGGSELMESEKPPLARARAAIALAEGGSK